MRQVTGNEPKGGGEAKRTGFGRICVPDVSARCATAVSDTEMDLSRNILHWAKRTNAVARLHQSTV